MTACQWLHQVETGQEATWGAEAAALSAVARTGVPVLPGFVVSRESVLSFFLQPLVRSHIMKACKGLSTRKPGEFSAVARDVREIILKASLPKEMSHSLAVFLEELENQVLHDKGKGLPLTLKAQNAPRTMHHGVPMTLTEAEKLLKQLFALDFTEQALYARFRAEESIVPAPYAVLVQYAPESELSGIAQQFDPITQDGTVIQIEVGHHEHPGDLASASDVYRYDRGTLHLLSREHTTHHWSAKKRGVHVSPRHAHRVSRADERQLSVLARFVRRAQEHFPDPQRFTWQLFLDSVVLTGVTPLSDRVLPAASEIERPPLVVGHAAHVGFARGVVRKITTKRELSRIEDGDIVVLTHLAEKDIPSLAGAAGLITENGHHTSIEVSAAKQLGIPAVTGATGSMHLLRNGQIITVDGAHGAVYAGRPALRDLAPHAQSPQLPITGTRIFAALDDALRTTTELLAPSDGIGMLRGEFIMRLLGVHPHELLHQGMVAEYGELLQEGVERAARAAGAKPVIYQLHDLSDHSFHGWKAWKRGSHEPNELIGNRGTRRLLSEPEILKLELQVLARLRQRGFDNISVMLPMVRSFDELKKMQKLLAKEFPEHAESLWIRVETPALTIKADALSKLPIAGVLFDVPALATLITGIDSHNHQLGHEHDQADPAVLDALEYAIAHCRREGVATTLLSENEPIRPEVVEAGIRAGLTAVCVRPEECGPLHGLVASIEQRMLLEHLVSEA